MEETRITLVCDNDVQRYKAFNQNPNFNIIFYKKNLIEVLWLLFLQAFIIFGFALDIPPRQNANKFGIALGLTVSLRNRKLYGYELYDTSKLER